MHGRRFPLETLEHIVAYIDFCSSATWGPQWKPFTPQWLLYPLLFVCREWYVVVRRALYTSVSLGNDRTSECGGGWSIAGGGEQICASFCETIVKYPYLSSLVRELRLGSYYVSEERDETFHHAQALSLCENVERVEIVGFTGAHLETLRITLFQMNLVELSITRAGLGGWSTRSLRCNESFCSASQIIAFILRCPRLTRLTTNKALHWRDEDGDLLPDASALTACCPELRDVILKEDAISTNHLVILTKVAPNMEKVSFGVKGDGANTLLSCLRSWTTTLTEIKLYSSYRHYYSATMLRIARKPRLEGSFALRSTNVPPAMLNEFARLEVITYFCATTHLEQLATLIQDPQYLPLLRRLSLRRDVGLWRQPTRVSDPIFTSLNAIQDACKTRCIIVRFKLDRTSMGYFRALRRAAGSTT